MLSSSASGLRCFRLYRSFTLHLQVPIISYVKLFKLPELLLEQSYFSPPPSPTSAPPMLRKCQSHRKEINSFLQLSLQRHRNKLPPNIGVLCNYCGAILSLPLQWMAIMHESELNLCESSFDQNIFTCQDISSGRSKSGWKSNKDYFNIIRKSAAFLQISSENATRKYLL